MTAASPIAIPQFQPIGLLRVATGGADPFSKATPAGTFTDLIGLLLGNFADEEDRDAAQGSTAAAPESSAAPFLEAVPASGQSIQSAPSIHALGVAHARTPVARELLPAALPGQSVQALSMQDMSLLEMSLPVARNVSVSSPARQSLSVMFPSLAKRNSQANGPQPVVTPAPAEAPEADLISVASPPRTPVANFEPEHSGSANQGVSQSQNRFEGQDSPAGRDALTVAGAVGGDASANPAGPRTKAESSKLSAHRGPRIASPHQIAGAMIQSALRRPLRDHSLIHPSNPGLTSAVNPCVPPPPPVGTSGTASPEICSVDDATAKGGPAPAKPLAPLDLPPSSEAPSGAQPSPVQPVHGRATPGDGAGTRSVPRPLPQPIPQAVLQSTSPASTAIKMDNHPVSGEEPARRLQFIGNRDRTIRGPRRVQASLAGIPASPGFAMQADPVQQTPGPAASPDAFATADGSVPGLNRDSTAAAAFDSLHREAETLISDPAQTATHEAPVAFEIKLTPVMCEPAAFPAVQKTVGSASPVTEPAGIPAVMISAHRPPIEATPGTPAIPRPPQSPRLAERQAGVPLTDRTAARAPSPSPHQPGMEQDSKGSERETSPRPEELKRSAATVSLPAPGEDAGQQGFAQSALPAAPAHTQGSPAPSQAVSSPDPAASSASFPTESPNAAPKQSVGSSTQQIEVRISPPQTAPVDLNISQRSGQIQVVVRTADSGLESSLRQDLNTLVRSLEHSGFRAEAFVPVSAASLAAASGSNSQAGSGQGQPDSSRHGSSSQGDRSGRGSGGDSRGNPSGDQNEREAWKDSWEEES